MTKRLFSKIIKRDGRKVKFESEKIIQAIEKAGQATGEFGREVAEKLTAKVLLLAKEVLKDKKTPTVEEIQDIVELVLFNSPFWKTARAYAIYREQHRQLREIVSQADVSLVDKYLEKVTWEIRENSNMTFSLQGLNNYVSSKIISTYWLNKIYPEEIRRAHEEGDFHLHDLSNLSVYCVGWDLYDLLLKGFGGVPGKIESKPAKHFHSALGQLVNFLYSLQGETAGAVAVSNFDTLLAPFIYYDKLSYREVSQALQEFLFNMNVPTRVGFQTPFSNITLDLTPPPQLANSPVLIGGKLQDKTYKEFQKEIDIFNKALLENFLEGDGKGRVFSFPIPTYNITKDFDWGNKNLDLLWRVTAKYGLPYFANFINSDMKPEDIRSMCLYPEEEVLIRNNRKVKRRKIGEIVENYRGSEFDRDGWSDCRPEKNLEVLSLNYQTGRTEWAKVIRFLKVKDNKLVTIFTNEGKRIKVSSKHLVPVLTPEGLINKFAEDVKEGDYLLGLKKSSSLNDDGEYQKLNDKLVLNEDLAKILGYFTADGNYLFETRKNLKTFGLPRGLQFTFNSETKENVEEIKSLIKKVFDLEVKERKDPRYHSYYLYLYKADLARILWQAGFRKYGRLPDILFNSPLKVIESFLLYHFKGDGYLKRKEIHINDKELARDLVLLYSLIGKPVTYRQRRNSQVIYLQHSCKERDKDSNFLLSQTLSQRVPGFLAKSTYLVPGLRKSRMVGLETLRKYRAVTQLSRRIEDSDYYISRVKKVEVKNLSYPQTFFDLELDKNHLFVHSLGTITHNCCRLRIDNRKLEKRGGGLFGSSPLTGCYDEKTEILTEDGWKLFKDLKMEDKVFTLSENNRIELHQPEQLFNYDYEGEMIEFKAKSLDLLVTPNHRMVVDKKYKKRRTFVEAKDFSPSRDLIPKKGIWLGKRQEYFELPPVVILQGSGSPSRFSDQEIGYIREMRRKGKSFYQIGKVFNCNPVTIYNICLNENYGNRQRIRIRYEQPPLRIKMNDWLKFFGFWLAEGSADNEKNAKRHGYRVIITQINREKKEEIKKVLDKLPFNYYEEENNLIICNKQLWAYLRQFGNKYTKFIPKEIKSLSKEQLKILFDWLVKGDGYIRKTTGQINYWTSSKKLADDLQEIILKLGWLATLKVNKRGKVSKINGRKVVSGPLYTIGVQKANYYRLRERNIERVYYKGKVYCCQVKNHTVFVRRNGKVCWSGNSIGVVTINMPRLGYLSKSKKEFKKRLERLMVLAKNSLEIKRKTLEKLTDKGLYPYSRYYLSGIKRKFSQWWKNHFSTIGLVGMNEACLNLFGEDIASEKSRKFTLEILDFMRKKLIEFQKETGNNYNLEATPAEGVSYRLPQIDLKKYPDIITAGTQERPFYTNSTQLPVNYTDDIFEAIELQDKFQCMYTGGTVVHLFVGEKISQPEIVKKLVKKVFEKFNLPYLTITPTFSICPNCGYLPGEQYVCPKCKANCEVYSRVVGYLRPVNQWNDGKQEEFKERKTFKIKE